MACCGCGTAVPMTKDQVENLINQQKNDGKLGTVSDVRWTDNTMSWSENGKDYTYTVKMGEFGNTIKLSVKEVGKFDVNTQELAGDGLKSVENKLTLDLDNVVGDYLKVENGKITLDLERLTPQYDGTGRVLLGYLVQA